jgi:hypothetical protein
MLLMKCGWRATAQGGGWLAVGLRPSNRSASVAFDIYLYYVRQGKK